MSRKKLTNLIMMEKSEFIVFETRPSSSVPILLSEPSRLESNIPRSKPETKETDNSLRRIKNILVESALNSTGSAIFYIKYRFL